MRFRFSKVLPTLPMPANDHDSSRVPWECPALSLHQVSPVVEHMNSSKLPAWVSWGRWVGGILSAVLCLQLLKTSYTPTGEGPTPLGFPNMYHDFEDGGEVVSRLQAGVLMS